MNKELVQDIKDLKEYTLNNPVFAMAAVQIGIPKRLVFVKSTKPDDTKNTDNQFIMVNPEIVSQKGRTEYWEACASGMENISLVERPYEVVVRYQTLNNETKIEKFEGFSATVISHELDHLDGIFHMDRAKEQSSCKVDERVNFRKTRPYKIISKDCEFSYDKPKKFQK